MSQHSAKTCRLPALRAARLAVMTPAERNRVVSAVKAEERRRKKAKEGTTRSALVAVGLVVLLAALAVPLLRRPKQLVETPPMTPDDARLKRPPERPGSTSHATADQAAASPVKKSPAGTPPRRASLPRTDEEGLAEAQAEVTRRTAAMGEKRAVGRVQSGHMPDSCAFCGERVCQ